MTSKKAYVILTLMVAAIFAVAFALIRVPNKPPGNFVDRGNGYEAATQPASYETKTDTQGAVTIEVKPIDLLIVSPVWKFEVTLDTHSVELGDDMAASAFLVDDAGNEYQAMAWDGDPPGGHHRKGILSFQTLLPLNVIRLRIRGVGGVIERTFQWKVK